MEWQQEVQAFDEAAAARLGLNLTDQRCLSFLSFQGPMPAGRLAAVSGLTSGAVTAAVDRWEKAGYARRRRAAEDRRSVLVELTPKAKRLIEAIWGPIGRTGHAILMRYSSEDLRLIEDFLRRCIDLQKNETKRLRGETQQRSARRKPKNAGAAPSVE